MVAYKPVQMIVFLEQDFGYKDIIRCSKYPAGTNLTVSNQVGADTDNDAAWLAKLRDKQIPESCLDRLTLCNIACSLELEMDKDSGENAKITLQLETGQPKPSGDYAKTILISKDATQHKIDVVLVGDYKVSDKFLVVLPTHEPLLVLRDPPGGGSYSYYENMVTTISVELEQWETFVGLNVEASGAAGLDLESTACFGLGPLFCTTATKVEMLATAQVGAGRDFEINTQLEKTKSATWTTTWSYNTGTDPWSAGKSSDVFLVPNLNVKFKEVREVTWSTTTCGKAESKLKFTLASPDNKPGLGFLSRYDIDNVEIPELTRIKSKNDKKMTDLKCENQPKQGENSTCTEARSNIVATQAAINAWNTFLNNHDNTTH